MLKREDVRNVSAATAAGGAFSEMIFATAYYNNITIKEYINDYSLFSIRDIACPLKAIAAVRHCMALL